MIRNIHAIAYMCRSAWPGALSTHMHTRMHVHIMHAGTHAPRRMWASVRGDARRRRLYRGLQQGVRDAVARKDADVHQRPDGARALKHLADEYAVRVRSLSSANHGRRGGKREWNTFLCLCVSASMCLFVHLHIRKFAHGGKSDLHITFTHHITWRQI